MVPVQRALEEGALSICADLRIKNVRGSGQRPRTGKKGYQKGKERKRKNRCQKSAYERIALSVENSLPLSGDGDTFGYCMHFSDFLPRANGIFD